MSSPLHKTTPSQEATKSPMFIARQDSNKKLSPLDYSNRKTENVAARGKTKLPLPSAEKSSLSYPTTNPMQRSSAAATTTTTTTTITTAPSDLPSQPKKSKFLSPQHWQGTVGVREICHSCMSQCHLMWLYIMCLLASYFAYLNVVQNSYLRLYHLCQQEEKNNGTIRRQSSVAKRQQQDQINKIDAVKNMYHKTHFSSEWMYATIVMHIIQFSLLLSVGMAAIPLGSAVMILLLVVIVALILIVARYRTHKLPKAVDWSYKTIRSPEQETDDVSDTVIYLLSLAVILECIAYALYPVSTTYISDIQNRSESITQILCFAAIINLSFHRIIRPANRLDPLRTILELEITNICWDALDGASLFALVVDTENLSKGTDGSARLLMCFW
jgi:hypothetical protein